MPAFISATRIAAAHEGDAEMVVTLTHDNGGLSEVALDRYAVHALLQSSQAVDTDGLIGVGWEHVRDALSVAFNLYQN